MNKPYHPAEIMSKALLHKLFITIALVLTITSKLFGELPEGRWVHLERQTPQHDITAIFPGDTNTIWVSTKYTLHAFDGLYWKKYSYSDQSLRDHTPFFRDPKGRYYFADGGKLIVLEDGKISRYDDEDIRSPIIAANGSDGTIYIGSYNIISGGVYSFDGSSVKKIRDGRVQSLTVDGQGRVWATILDADAESIGLMVLEGNEWIDKTAIIESILPAKTNELIVQAAPDGSIWVNNLGKYGVLRDGEWTIHDGGSGPVFLAFESSGKVWGYRYKTIYRLNTSGNWDISRTNETSIPNKPQFLTEDSNGTLWMFDSHNVYTYQNSEWTVVENNLDLASDRVTCMVYTDDGKLMCGHGVRSEPVSERDNSGISVWDGESWYNFTKAENTFLYNVYILERSPDDNILIHTDHGLKLFDGKYWSDVDTLQALDIADITWDDSGIMWVASYNGLVEYNYPHFDFKVNPEWLYPFKIFYNLHFNDDGELFMQTNYGAIVSYNEEREDPWLSHESTTTNNRDIAIDEDGTLWCARSYNLSWWHPLDGWKNVAELNDGRMVDIDDAGRIWASGFGTTGYYEDNTWHIIPDLLPYASDRFIGDGTGRYFINAFDIDDDENPPVRNDFYGLFVFTPGPVNVDDEGEPEQFIVVKNYPNPFNSSTTISFSLPDPGIVSVTVYNLNGQKVKTLAFSWFPAGKNSIIWDSTSDTGLESASGMYFYRVSAGDSERTGKMLLLR